MACHVRANTQFDPFIIVNRQNPNIIAATSSTIINGNSNQGKYISNDAGISWSGTDDLDPNYSLLFFDGNGDNGNGNVAIDASGRIYMTTVGPDGRQVFITKSTNNGTSFSPLTPILSPPLVYVSHAPRIATDDVSTSQFANNLYFVFLQRNPYEPHNRLTFVRSTDQGSTFSQPLFLAYGNYDITLPNIQTGPNGQIYITFIASLSNPVHGFYFVRSTDGGNTFTQPLFVPCFTGIEKQYNVPNNDMNYILTPDYVSIAVDKSSSTHNGRIYTTFATQENGNGKSIVQLAYSDDNGNTWSIPRTVSYANTLQSWRPWVCIDQTNGNVFVAYSSIFNITSDNHYRTNIYVAISFDGGNTFITQLANDTPFDTKAISQYYSYGGKWVGITAHGGKVYPIWYSNLNGYWQNYISEIDVTPAISGLKAFCGTTQYSLVNIPPGTPVTWTTSASSIVSVPTSGNPITASEVSQGFATLTASVNGNAVASLNVTTKPSVTINYYSIGCSNGTQTWSLNATPNMPSSSNWHWTVDDPTSGIYIYYPNAQNTNADVPRSHGGGVSVTYTDGCGQTSYRDGVTIYNSCGFSYSYTVAPNPASSSIKISTNLSNNPTDTTSFSVVNIYDLQNNLKKHLLFGRVKSATIDVSDLLKGFYIVEIVNGDYKNRQKLQVIR